MVLMKKKVGIILLIIVLLVVILVIGLNLYIILSTKTRIKQMDEINDNDIDCILVLGAGIRGNNPSPMLEERLLTAEELYRLNLTNKIIVSGDHGSYDYDEVNVMKNYLLKRAIPSENIFMDHAGFSTYDSIYRAKEIFGAKKIVIVTQKYHLYRALYIADELGIEAYGISSNKRKYQNQLKRDIREFVARIKDFIKCIYKPEATILGDTISVMGDGNVTND